MMDKKAGYHMGIEEFRKNGKEIIDWIADYYTRVEKYPVLSQVKPGEIRSTLSSHPPQDGEAFDEILEDFNKYIIPGITHWQSPNFYAYFPANVTGPSILGDLLSSGLGVQGMLWATSPSCTELETLVMDWIADIQELPDKFKSDNTGGGVIQDSASSAALCALLAARELSTGYQTNLKGVRDNFTVYISTQTHSSVEKACMIAGIGRDNIRLIDVDNKFAMRYELLRDQIKKDRLNGCIPIFVCGTLGTTSSLAMDPISDIGKICKEEKIWFHIDAAMAGTAAICPEYRSLLNGIEYADSYSFNPHKWMFTNFDCNCFFVADKSVLIKTLSLLPEYLKNEATSSGNVINYRDWQISLGRKFRALKLWFVIRHYGVNGLRYHIREHVRIARELASWIEENENYEIVSPVNLNLICFRHIKGDDFNKKLLDMLNKTGKIYLTHTKLNNSFVLRLCVGQTNTTLEHVKRSWELIKKTASELKC
jgi:aromatic-L-amino-acid/L-tryptophan decarboxylase